MLYRSLLIKKKRLRIFSCASDVTWLFSKAELNCALNWYSLHWCKYESNENLEESLINQKGSQIGKYPSAALFGSFIQLIHFTLSFVFHLICTLQSATWEPLKKLGAFWFRGCWFPTGNPPSRLFHEKKKRSFVLLANRFSFRHSTSSERKQLIQITAEL